MGRREGVKGEGQGIFHPPCHVLHYHMVLRPKRDFAQSGKMIPKDSYVPSFPGYGGFALTCSDLCHLSTF